ncbi:MAG: helix-turn-helix transcriptional regulator [Kineosporiaceae bacterium]
MTETSPTAQRREVGTLLRAHRERVGLTAAEVAARVGVSAAKLSRLERGLRGLQISDVRSLCTLYRLSDAETRDLVAATRASREPGWWSSFNDLGVDIPMLFGLESVANKVEEFGALLVPGLLQTAEYAAAMMSRLHQEGGFAKSVIDERVEARMKRSSLLLPKMEKRFHFIIDEAALRRCVGSAEVMDRQVRAIADCGAADNVEIQVIPFTTGAHPGVDGSFAVRVFDEGVQRNAVFVEGLAGSLLIDQGAQVAAYRRAFEELSELALEEKASLRMLRLIAGDWRKVI